MKLHEKILLYINYHGIKQTWLAGQIDISVKTLNAILLGRQRLTADMFELICLKGLKVDPSIFFNNNWESRKQAQITNWLNRLRPGGKNE